MKTFTVKPNDIELAYPKWYQFRLRIANMLINLANKIYPEHPKVKAYFVKALMDYNIYGDHIARVEPEQFYKPKECKHEGHVRIGDRQWCSDCGALAYIHRVDEKGNLYWILPERSK